MVDLIFIEFSWIIYQLVENKSERENELWIGRDIELNFVFILRLFTERWAQIFVRILSF